MAIAGSAALLAGRNPRAFASASASPARAAMLPATMLWAWERPEDLRFVDPSRVGVAFLARTIALDAGIVRVRPRMQPLAVPPRTRMVAVVRIEIGQAGATLSALQRADTTAAIVAAARDQVDAVQIDFDARESERAFYRQLLLDVRQGLPRETSLQITALASWCLQDGWLDGLPIDDAVPMLFRMGPDWRAIKSHLNGGGDFGSRVCRQSLGLSTDEASPRVPPDRRRYIFNPRAWTPGALDRFLKGLPQ